MPRFLLRANGGDNDIYDLPFLLLCLVAALLGDCNSLEAVGRWTAIIGRWTAINSPAPCAHP